MHRLAKGITNPSVSIGIAVLLFFAALEICFQVFTPFWDRMYPARLQKAAQYQEMLKSGKVFDRIYIGSSTTLMGVNPLELDAVSGGTSYNAGQLNYSRIDVNRIVISEIIKAGAAKTIVYLMDSWAGTLPPARRVDLDNQMSFEHILDLSAVFRNRAVFIFWVKELLAGNWMLPSRAWHEHLKTSHQFKSFDGFKLNNAGYLDIDGHLDPDWPGYLRPTLFGDQQIADFRSILDLCKRSGVGFVLVRLPEYQRTYNENGPIHSALSAKLSETLEPYGFPLIDLSLPGSFPHNDETLFFDIHHVNSAGSPIFSQLLGQRLVQTKRAASDAAAVGKSSPQR
jgi:hypothetical protein